MEKRYDITRRRFLSGLAASAAGMLFAGRGRADNRVKAKSDRPNVVLIVSDDQGFADASCYFHPKEVNTASIDKLADEGVRFTNGYASGWVCAPTRAGLLTGRYQQRFGFYTAGDSRTGLPLNEITIADVLKKQGYATGIFGKWHVGIEREYHPLKRGFDEFYGFLGHGAHDYFELGRTDEYTSIYRNNKIIDDTGYLTDNLAREAVSFIERHRAEPFFLYLPFNAVHWPMQAPKEDIEQFDTGEENRDIYLAMLKRMDTGIGKVLEALKQMGVDRNTLILFFSDNGGAQKNYANNGKLRDFKQSVYEGGIRVPFIVRWPAKLPAGAVCDEPVICLDIMPTICAAVGAELPRDRVYDGKNMLPVISGKAREPLHEALFWDGGEVQWGVRTGKWKLLTNRRGELELYNLEEDLSEKSNVIEEHPDIAERLKHAYSNWKSKMGARLVRPKSERPRSAEPKSDEPRKDRARKDRPRREGAGRRNR